MSQRSPLLPIFLIVLVDVLGFTIVIPLLSLYAETFGASPLVATTLVSVYALCSLLSTPIIGKLSDRYGRKPLLLVSQAGTCLGFLLIGSARSLWMVFLGRTLDGLTAGNLSLAQAYISDHTAPEDRAKSFGVIGIAFGIGFMAGPGLGGYLDRYEDIAGIHPAFLAASALSALSILATAMLLSREKPPQDAVDDRSGPRESIASTAPSAGRPRELRLGGRGPETPYNDGPGGRRPGAFDVATYAEYFRRPQLRALYVQFVLFSFAFSAFFSGFALFAERRFTRHGAPWTAAEVGYLFMFSGFLGIILQGGILGRLVKRYGEYRLTVAGFAAGVVAYLLVGLAPADNIPYLIGITVISAFANGVLRPVITARITKAVGRHEQGVALGISGSLGSLAMAVAPPTGGAMLSNHWTLGWALIPTTVATLGLFVTVMSGVGDAPVSSPP